MPYWISESENGAVRFQSGGVGPEGAVSVDEETYRARMADVAPPVAALGPAITYKADLYRRASDVEAEAIEEALMAAPVRQRRLFEAAQYLDHSAEEFAALRAALIELFGGARADELLAVS